MFSRSDSLIPELVMHVLKSSTEILMQISTI